MSHILTWRKVIGIGVAVLGIGLSMSSIAGWMIRSSGGTSGGGLVGSLITIGALLFLSLAYPLCVGRIWARRSLVVIVACICAVTVVLACSRVIRESRSSGAPLTDEMRWEGRLLTVIEVGMGLWRVTPSIFVLFVLLHPDVARAFQNGEREEKASERAERRR